MEPISNIKKRNASLQTQRTSTTPWKYKRLSSSIMSSSYNL